MGWQRFGMGLIALTAGCAGGQEPAQPRPEGPAALVTEIEPGAVLNRPPRFVTLAPLVAREGRAYNYDVGALDPDGDEVRFSLVQAPAGATLAGEVLQWVPRPDQVGRAQSFSLLAVDDRGGFQVQHWEVVPESAAATALARLRRQRSRSADKNDRSAESRAKSAHRP